MKKTHLFGIIILFAFTLTLVSCGGAKKCNGRGIKTPMGVM